MEKCKNLEKLKCPTTQHGPIIGLDIDGVVADFEKHFLEYLNLDTSPATSWDDPRFRSNFHLIENDIEFWMGIPPIENIPDMDVFVYVTARPIPSDVSELWLKNNSLPFAPVITVGVGNSKLQSLKGKVDIFIDDNIDTFEELNAAGIDCYLMTRNHNRHYKCNKRINSLNEFIETI